jgi:hypothetical protein
MDDDGSFDRLDKRIGLACARAFAGARPNIVLNGIGAPTEEELASLTRVGRRVEERQSFVVTR